MKKCQCWIIHHFYKSIVFVCSTLTKYSIKYSKNFTWCKPKITISFIFFIFTGLVKTSLFFSSSRFLWQPNTDLFPQLSHVFPEVTGLWLVYWPDLEQGVFPDLRCQIEAGSRGDRVEYWPWEEAGLGGWAALRLLVLICDLLVNGAP